jgi:hypothetical protein
MRLILAMPIMAAAVAGLAACGQSDDAFRASYRTKAVEACSQGARSAAGSAGVDANRLCSCMVDNYMRATSTEQLKAERDKTTPPPAARAAMMQCAREQAGAMSAPAPVTPPAANEAAAPAPEVPAAEEGEAAEGNETGGQ